MHGVGARLLLLSLSLFFSSGLQKRDNQVPDQKREQDDFHGTERFFAWHEFSPLQNLLAFANSTSTHPEFLTIIVSLVKMKMCSHPGVIVS